MPKSSLILSTYHQQTSIHTPNMRSNNPFLPLIPCLTLTHAQLAHPCGPSSSNIICISSYTSVLPSPFYRNVSTDSTAPPSSYASTSVPSDPSFALISNASFLIFDSEKAFPILGDNPTYEYMFKVNDGKYHFLFTC
jgi:hypothetical protein